MRILIFIALLCVAVQGKGQIYIDSYRFGIAETSFLLLDSFTNASAAYSLRLLRTAYTGNCLTVRRTNGDTSLIGFSSNFLDTVALKTFCGTSSTDTCWVRRWFDQSGNSANMSQTTNANQPSILLGGALVYKSGNLAIDFDGANDLLTGSILSAYITASTYTNFNFVNIDTIVADQASGVNDNLFADVNAYYGVEFRRNANRYTVYNYDNNLDIVSININLNTKYLLYNAHYGGNLYSAINANTQSSTASGNTGSLTSLFRIGRGYDATAPTSNYFNGKVHEIIFYKTDQSANRTAISNNINTFYSIY